MTLVERLRARFEATPLAALVTRSEGLALLARLEAAEAVLAALQGAVDPKRCCLCGESPRLHDEPGWECEVTRWRAAVEASERAGHEHDERKERP